MRSVGNQTITEATDGAQSKPLRVLLIEDSPLIRRSLVEAIDASGVLRVTAYADSARSRPSRCLATRLSMR